MIQFLYSKKDYQLFEVKMKLLKSLGQNISSMSLRHTGVRKHKGEPFHVKLMSHRKEGIVRALPEIKETGIFRCFWKPSDQYFNLSKFHPMPCRLYFGSRFLPTPLHVAPIPHWCLYSLWGLLLKEHLVDFFLCPGCVTVSQFHLFPPESSWWNDKFEFASSNK